MAPSDHRRHDSPLDAFRGRGWPAHDALAREGYWHTSHHSNLAPAARSWLAREARAACAVWWRTAFMASLYQACRASKTCLECLWAYGDDDLVKLVARGCRARERLSRTWHRQYTAVRAR